MRSATFFAALLLLAAPLVHSRPQGQPGTTTKSEIAVTALSNSGKPVSVTFQGIPGLKGVPKCGADMGLDSQQASPDQVFCRTLRSELSKAGVPEFSRGGEVKIVGFATSESTTTTTASGGAGGNPGQNGGQGGAGGQNGGSGGAGGAASNQGKNATPVTSFAMYPVPSAAGGVAGLVVLAGALVM